MPQLACDASIVELVERDGVPLSVGRKTRTIPPAIRWALQARDRRCSFPGCENRRFLHAHHIKHWARGGETKLDNLVLLCSRHHRFVHEAGYSIRARGEGKLEFRDPWGGPIPNTPRPPPGDAGLLVERNRGLQIDSVTCARGDGDRMDLGYAVDALLALVARTSSLRTKCSSARKPGKIQRMSRVKRRSKSAATEKAANESRPIELYENWRQEDEEGRAVRLAALTAAAGRWREGPGRAQEAQTRASD